MLLAAAATGAWCASCAFAWRHFRRALRDPAAAQAQVLQEILSAAQHSEFGRAHGFEGLRDPAQFQAAVPPRDYEEHAPWIERIGQGETHLLTGDGPQDRITRFEPTSGSTRGARLIPHNTRLRQQFNRAIGPWIVDLYRHRPSLAAGPAWWSVSPALPPRTSPAGLPIGFEDDSAYLGAWSQALLRHALAVPGALSRVQDVALFQRLTLQCLLNAPDLRLISVWNPSFFTLMMEPLAKDWDSLLRGVAEGVREGPVILPPNPRRALALASLPSPSPTLIWPRLGLFSCWTQAHAAQALPAAQALLPGVPVQPKGLLATEGVVTIPWGGAFPVAVLSHFYELLSPSGVKRVEQWQEGDEGSLLLTTGGGLYRYHLRDRVRVQGFVDRTPSLVFLGKEDRVSDRRGEKLSEAFVAQVLARLLPSGGFALLAPEDQEPPFYALYTSTSPPDPALLDQALRENPHYDWCRSLGQLGPARVRRVTQDAPHRYLAHLREKGLRLGDIKPSCLSLYSNWSTVFPILEDR